MYVDGGVGGEEERAFRTRKMWGERESRGRALGVARQGSAGPLLSGEQEGGREVGRWEKGNVGQANG